MRRILRDITEHVQDTSLPLRLTLLLILMRPPSAGAVRGLTWLVAAAALLFPTLLCAPGIWLALAALVGARIFSDWPLADNHIYLLAYWCFGLGLCQAIPQSAAAIARMSRWLIGSVFLCAVIWKGLLAPDFLAARFFRVTLITDDRFSALARSVGGLTAAQLAANREALVGLPAGAEVIGGPVLFEPAALQHLGLALTWGGFLLEASLACAFLLSRPAPLHGIRDLLLMIFAVATYAAAPVAGFGWLLAAMGCAQCDPDRIALRAGYLAVFALVLVYSETPLVPLLLRS